MKRIPFLMTLVAMTCSTGGFGARAASIGKTLVVYFSHSGNTRVVAERIARATGADLCEIVPAKPYPTDYRTVVDQAKREIEAGYRPALAAGAPDPQNYDVVFVGSPCWWYTIAPPIATWLAAHDFSGKRIIPFMTHEGSRMGHSEQDIRELCSGATVAEGLPVRGGAVSDSAPAVEKWLAKLGVR